MIYISLTKQRRSRNRIVGLHDERGHRITNEVGMEKVAEEYFENIFKSTSPSDFKNFILDIQSSITSQMNGQLTAVATEEEVCQDFFYVP